MFTSIGVVRVLNFVLYSCLNAEVLPKVPLVKEFEHSQYYDSLLESVAGSDLVFTPKLLPGNSSAAAARVNITRGIRIMFCLEHNDNVLFEIKTF